MIGLCQSSGYRFQPTGTASDTSARAALAQSMSFCTVGAPLSPIAPTTSPFTLMGNPPPHAAIRASVGMPAKSDGSLWIKLKNYKVYVINPDTGGATLLWQSLLEDATLAYAYNNLVFFSACTDAEGCELW